MKVRVVVSFVDKGWYTRSKGLVLDLDEAYATELIERGKVEPVDQPESDKKVSKNKSGKRKVSKGNARKAS